MRIGARFAAMVCVSALVYGCGKYPEVLETRSDIRWAGADSEMLNIGGLPTELIPDLEKFTNVSALTFKTGDDCTATDDRLRALAKLRLNSLRSLSVRNGSQVTGAGISAIASLPQIAAIDMEGTAVSDDALQRLSTSATLRAINVARCQHVTVEGVQALARTARLEELVLSARGWNVEQVTQLLSTATNLQYLCFKGPAHNLDTSIVMRARGERKISISFLE